MRSLRGGAGTRAHNVARKNNDGIMQRMGTSVIIIVE